MLNGKKVLFSGMQSTGNLTLGNYLGALKNWGLADVCIGIAANEYCFYRMLSILSAKRTRSRRYQAFYDAWLLCKRNYISPLFTGCHAACRSVGGVKNGFVSGKQRTADVSWKVLQKGDINRSCG